jgi:hypothetical protein
MKPIVEKDYVLQKFPGKGGWTYTVIEEVKMDKRSKFGWVQVSGFVDDFELKNYKLMPLGNGQLFLPVRTEIRKKIGKNQGDIVHVVLYLDDSTAVFPDEIIDCIKDEPEAYKTFLTFTAKEQHAYINWVLEATKDEIKVERIVLMIKKLLRAEKL